MSFSTSGGTFSGQTKAIERFVVVTGGSGKVGRATVALLKAQTPKIFVVSLDIVPPPADSVQPDAFVTVELSNYGDVLAALLSVDDRYTLSPTAPTTKFAGLVHLAAIPGAGLRPNHVMFTHNTSQAYNFLEAARQLGYTNIVQASSETLIGIPLKGRVLPDRLPIDEEQQARPESAYSLSKLVGETIAKEYCRWNPNLKIVDLRFSNVMEPRDYPNFSKWTEEERTWNAFGYIDSRSAASSILASLQLETRGHHFYLIANPDTCVPEVSTKELVKKHFPTVEYKAGWTGEGGEGEGEGEMEGLLSTAKARRELGWRAEWGWRNEKKGVSKA